MDGEDHLSALSDDLLRRILYFVPFKEAASTSVLSRRRVSLWRSSGAFNLAGSVQITEEDVEVLEDFFSRRDAFVAAAAEAPVTRLTLRVEASRDDHTAIDLFLNSRGEDYWRTHRDVVGEVVAHTAASRVEELQIAAVNPFHDSVYSRAEANSFVGIYPLLTPPSERLRVLDLSKCRDLKVVLAPAAFPRLATLRLRLCCVQITDLEALFDAAPELATVHLESALFLFKVPRVFHAYPTEQSPVVRLCCPAAATLVLELCGFEGQERSIDGWAMEIDAPMLRSFRYKGLMRRFLLSHRRLLREQ